MNENDRFKAGLRRTESPAASLRSALSGGPSSNLNALRPGAAPAADRSSGSDPATARSAPALPGLARPDERARRPARHRERGARRGADDAEEQRQVAGICGVGISAGVEGINEVACQQPADGRFLC